MWVIIVAAPILWLVLWLVGQPLWAHFTHSAATAVMIDHRLRPWVTVAANVSLLIWVVSWFRRDGRRLAELGLTTAWLPREALVGLLVGLVLWAMGQVPLWVLGLGDLDPAFWLLLMGRMPSRIVRVIAVAACEEVTWRGYAITELHRLYRLSASVVIAVIAFVVFHLGETLLFDWMILPKMLYVGGWLSVLYLWRRSLIAPIVAHVVLGGLGFV